MSLVVQERDARLSLGVSFPDIPGVVWYAPSELEDTCPSCGEAYEIEWVNVLSLVQDPDDPDTPQWTPALARCPNGCDSA